MNIKYQLLVDPTILNIVVDLLPGVDHHKSIDSACRIFTTTQEKIDALTELLADGGIRAFMRRVQYIGPEGTLVKTAYW